MTTKEEYEVRENLLADIILHLTKTSKQDLELYTVQEIVEGFWLSREAEALLELKPFELKGE